jgi:ATP dependent DNA ligase domain
VACDSDGLPVFDRLRYRRQDGRVFLFAFDLLELNGRDMRREPLEVRKAALAGVLGRMKAWAGIQLNEHCDDLPVDVVFRHACKLGFEGIVSKRVGSPYRSGRSRDWLKMKNPNAPAVKREAEEDWGRGLLSAPRCSGALLPPSPPAEQATARQDQAGKARLGDGAGDGTTCQPLVVRQSPQGARRPSRRCE